MTHEGARGLIERRFTAPGLPVEDEARLRTHLRDCAPCRRIYDQAAVIEQALAGDVLPPAAEARLLARVPGGRPRRWWPALALAAAAAVVAVGLALRPDGVPLDLAPAELQARSGEVKGRKAWISLYVRRAGQVSPAPAVLHPSDGLQVAWTAMRDAEVGFLAVAGRDAAGQVQWYFPAWLRPEDAPVSLPITPGGAAVELPEVVFIEPAAGLLEVCALFSQKPLVIKDIDPAIAAGRWPDVLRDCHTFEVKPRP